MEGPALRFKRSRPNKAQVLLPARTELQAMHPLEDFTDMSSVPTFLACGAFFVLSFVTISAFWFVERLRGANAPHVRKPIRKKLRISAALFVTGFGRFPQISARSQVRIRRRDRDPAGSSGAVK